MTTEMGRSGIDVAGGRDIPFEDSIPEVGAPLESILCTEELQRPLRVRLIMKGRTARWWPW